MNYQDAIDAEEKRFIGHDNHMRQDKVVSKSERVLRVNRYIWIMGEWQLAWACAYVAAPVTALPDGPWEYAEVYGDVAVVGLAITDMVFNDDLKTGMYDQLDKWIDEILSYE